MRLAAVVDLDLDARGDGPRARRRASSSGGSSSPVSSVRIPRPPSSRRSTTAPATASKLVAARDRGAVGEAEPRALAHRRRRPGCTSRDAIVTSPVATTLSGLRHLALVLRGRRAPRRRTTIAASPACTDRVGTTRIGLFTSADRLLGAEDHVRVVRQHDHLGRRRRVDRRDDVLGGRVHRLPALDHARRAAGSRRAGGCLPRARRRRCRSRASEGRRASPRRAAPRARASAGACWRSRRPRSCRRAVPMRQRGPGIVRVDVNLERGRDRRRRAASRRAARARARARRRRARRPRSRRPCSSGTRDSSWCIASTRDRRGRGRRLGERLAGDGGAQASDDLEQAGAARVDDACLLQHREQLRRAGERLLAARDDESQQLQALERRAPRATRPPRPSRG